MTTPTISDQAANIQTALAGRTTVWALDLGLRVSDWQLGKRWRGRAALPGGEPARRRGRAMKQW